MSLIKTAHEKLKAFLYSGATVIDATSGNGNDSLFLAEQVYPGGKLFAFDIQEAACVATRQKLGASPWNNHHSIQQADHADLLTLIPCEYHGKIAVCMFNLGYLPGSDKSIITQAATSLKALDAACQLLAESGIISVMVYPGHPGGEPEALAVDNWCSTLDSSIFTVDRYFSTVAKTSAPYLLIIQRLR
jgi:SAM-dependent methyltransferase